MNYELEPSWLLILLVFVFSALGWTTACLLTVAAAAIATIWEMAS